jgi:hypothetical protein
MARFFNPGFAWNDTLKYDNPVGDIREMNNISYYRIDAPARGFFNVKDTMTMTLPTGEEYDVPLRFKELVRSTYAERGVVLVTPNRECGEDENIAPTDEEAKKKGNAIWKEYMKAKANEWNQIVYEVKAAGQLPRAATGLFKRVLEELAMPDPADIATGFAQAKEGQQSNLDLQQQIAALTATVNQLIGAKSAQGK